MIDKEALITRSREIHSKVNVLEKLFKTCQLTNAGLAEPILNEMRYLSRALADVLFFQYQDDEEWYVSLLKSEHAIHNAINDSIDSLNTFVKSTLSGLEQNCPAFMLSTSAYGEEYIQALKSIEHVDTLIVYSRGSRTERYETYKRLSEEENPSHLDKIATFALKLPQIEAIALRSLEPSNPSFYSDEFLLDAMLSAANPADAGEAVFSMALQPKYKQGLEGEDKELIGAEALMRLSVKGAPIYPSSFIPVAERGHLIASVDALILKLALNALSDNDWIPRISVNVSAIELLSPSYAQDVLELISASGVSPERIELEVTEGSVINDMSSEAHLHKLSKAGVHISIDDFGTGVTKFDYLAKLPVDVIKIDRSLVLAHANAPESYGVLLKAISAVGSACEIDVIAEGVDAEEQVLGLRKLGIKYFQGYYYGKPVPLSDFIHDHGPKI